MRAYFGTNSEDLEFKKLIWSGVLMAIQSNKQSILESVANVISFLYNERAVSHNLSYSILTRWPTVTLSIAGLSLKFERFSYTVCPLCPTWFCIWRRTLYRNKDCSVSRNFWLIIPMRNANRSAWEPFAMPVCSKNNTKLKSPKKVISFLNANDRGSG